MYKYSRCLCVLLLFVLFSLYAVPVLAADNESFDYTDLPFTEDDFDSFDEYLQAVNMYLDPESAIMPLGTIDSSELTSENVTVRIYAGPYANWYTEETFASNADLAYTKTFAISSMQSNLNRIGASNAKRPDVVFNSYFNPLWGYTVTYNLADDSTVSNSVLDFELNFDGDTAYSVNNQAACLVYTTSSFSSLSSTTTSASWVKNLYGSMPSLVGAGGAYNVSSNGTTYWIGAMHNTLSFIGITTSGEQVSLGSYEDTTGGKYSIKLPKDTEFKSFVFDMSYYYASDGFPDSDYWSGYYFPYMYKCDFSGSITFNQNSAITGALNGIITWLKSIFSAIQSLPTQIANLIIDGIKSLFVPTAEDLSSVFETATGKLEERLGFVYQITTWLFDLFDTLISASTNTQDTITLPKLALPWENVPEWAQLPNNELLIWNEQEFKVIPEGAESLQTIVKTLTSLWAVLSLVACCVDSYHDFVGESPIYRLSQERIETKKAAEQIVGGGKRRR